MMDDCDDPYKMLANNLVATYPEHKLRKIYNSPRVVRRMIDREVANADFYGDFLDCIITELVKKNKRGEVTRTLSPTASLFYHELDMKRFRKELLFYAELYGKNITLPQSVSDSYNQ